MLEDDVRLDQVLAGEGDRLWYDYNFGDGWKHVLRVEKVLDDPPSTPVCVGGRLACPPEDCGGVWGYTELANWVRADYNDELRPEVFDSATEGRDWLPYDWHPDVFDLEVTNELIKEVAAEPIPIVGELESLLELARNRGANGLRTLLASPCTSGVVEVTVEDAAILTEPFRVLLHVIGDGLTLTGAGYLKPAVVDQIARRTGLTEWWIGKANREDLTWPVTQLRLTAQALGLVSVRKGPIAPTKAIAKHADDSQAILRHVVGRVPIGRSPSERQAGWMALLVVASETPAELWKETISELLLDLGWRDSQDPWRLPSPESPTLDPLRLLAGAMREGGRLQGANTAVAAIARTVIQA